MAGIEPKVIEEMDNQIQAFKKTIETAGEEGRNKLKSVNVDEVLREVPRTAEGKLDPAAWSALKEAKQQELHHRLTFVRDTLRSAADLDGPTDPKSIMYDAYAKNASICIWTALGLALTAFLLVLIVSLWDQATGARKEAPAAKGAPGTSEKRDQGAAVKPSEPAATQSEREKEAPTGKPQAAAKGADKTKKAAVETKPQSGSAQDQKTLKEAQKTPEEKHDQEGTPKNTQTNQASQKQGVAEGTVLTMVILLGALGGSLHLASSLVMFIGNRQLKRSWLPYYLSMPFTGAGLAPIVYMLLRVGLINPSGTSADGTAISSLNLIAIYAFGALTGMFSRVALAKFGEIFGTMFRTETRSKDPMGSKKPPGDTK